MIEIQAVQGSEAWHAARAKCFTASEAPGMMGVSKYMTRSELLRQKATGLVPEIDAATQRRFDEGHKTEAMARTLVEAIIGEELYPIVATDDSGKYLASSDGATMLCNLGFEHKLWNTSLAKLVSSGEVPESHRWQLDHQCFVFGFDQIIFVVSDGTMENMAHCLYRPTTDRIAALLDGWDQFEKDLADYQHVETKPAAVAEVVKDLPAVMVQVSGSVSIVDNFVLFETALRDFVENKLVRSPQTDQDFVDLDAQIKSLKKAEDALDAAEVQMIAQVASVDSMKRTKDMLHKLARDNRLMAEKLLKAEKENRKGEIVIAASREFGAHCAALSSRVGVSVNVAVSFAYAIKGLKSLDSMRDKVSVALANAKIEANAIADRIEANIKSLEESSSQSWRFLFPDLQAVCTKASDDFAALLAARKASHATAESSRIEKIRAEEKAKAEAAAAAKVAEEARIAKAEADAKAATEKAEANRIAAEEIRRIDEQRKAAALAEANRPAEEAKTVIPVVEQKQYVADVTLTNEGNIAKTGRNNDMKRLQFRSELITRIDAMNAVQMANLIAYLDAQVIRERIAA